MHYKENGIKNLCDILIDADIASSLIKKKKIPNPKPCDDNKQALFNSNQSRRV